MQINGFSQLRYWFLKSFPDIPLQRSSTWRLFWAILHRSSVLTVATSCRVDVAWNPLPRHLH